MATRKSEVTETVVENVAADKSSSVSTICTKLTGLSLTEIRAVMDHCSQLIAEIEKAEIAKLEAEMQSIREKMQSIRGSTPNSQNGGRRKAVAIVNPDDPTQTYTYGKHSDWLVKLMEKTGKSIAQLREEAQSQ